MSRSVGHSAIFILAYIYSDLEFSLSLDYQGQQLVKTAAFTIDISDIDKHGE